MKTWICGLVAIAIASSPAQAENILITNDDGLTSNLKALYTALKAQGHDVIVSVPCQGQSGMGAAIKFMRPLGPLVTNCLNDAAKAGDPGVGPMTRAGFETDFHYVDGTPVMATLYGLDVLAQTRWGKMPDLVISGPNEGRNVGTMIVSSGTVSNVQYSTARGVPSIAVSAGTNSVDNAKLANPNSALVAERTAELVGKLFANKAKSALLPTGIALNINLPDDVAKAKWKATRIGSYEIYDIRFTADMGKSEAAAAFGLGGVHKPGMVLGFNKTPPRADQSDDEAGVSLTHISISAVQIGYEPGARQNPDKWLRRLIKKLDGK